MPLKDTQHWLDPGQGDGPREYITPDDVKHAFEQVYFDVGIHEDQLGVLQHPAGQHMVLALPDPASKPSRVKPDPKDPKTPNALDKHGVLHLVALEDLLPTPAAPLPPVTQADAGHLVAVKADGSGYELIDPASLALTDADKAALLKGLQDAYKTEWEEFKKKLVAALSTTTP